MSTKHTPGPWLIEEEDFGDEWRFGGRGAGQITVGQWVSGGCKDNSEEWAQLQADARLIAAAPCMLASLIKAREFISFDRNALADSFSLPDDSIALEAQAEIGDYDQMLLEINAAIAKATGGAA